MLSKEKAILNLFWKRRISTYTFINFSAPDRTALGYHFHSTPMEVHIVSFHMSMDIDDNGEVEALTDGLLLIRYLLGFTGENLVNGAVAPDARQTDPSKIALHIENLMTPNNESSF